MIRTVLIVIRGQLLDYFAGCQLTIDIVYGSILLFRWSRADYGSSAVGILFFGSRRGLLLSIMAVPCLALYQDSSTIGCDWIAFQREVDV